MYPFFTKHFKTLICCSRVHHVFYTRVSSLSLPNESFLHLRSLHDVAVHAIAALCFLNMRSVHVHVFIQFSVNQVFSLHEVVATLVFRCILLLSFIITILKICSINLHLLQHLREISKITFVIHLSINLWLELKNKHVHIL